METLKAIRTRTSVKNYLEKPVDDAIITKVINAGLEAPSARNLRPYKVFVIKNRHVLMDIASLSPAKLMLNKAPVALCVVGDSLINSDVFYLQQDCSAVTENMLVAANSLGLGTCWLGVSPNSQEFHDKLAKILELDNNHIIVSLVALGYASGDFKPKEGRYTRNEIITIE